MGCLAICPPTIDPDFSPFYAASMEKRMLVLDGSIDRSIYRPVEQWARYLGDVRFDAVHLPSNAPIPSLDRYTHVLLTGSEASFARPEAWFEVEADIVRDAVDRGLTVLGSCFGHQMLAWALSGRECVRRAPIPEVGWVAVQIVKSDPLVADLASPWHTFAAHLDEVVEPPPPWCILASNEACSVQAMRYGDRPVWGIQPHPETSPEEAVFQMERGMERYPEYAQQIRQAMESPVRDDRATPQLMEALLRSNPYQE
jgi:GMP synthase-like glutamine amidotransferase